jgi:hypothetical protein
MECNIKKKFYSFIHAAEDGIKIWDGFKKRQMS